MTVPSPEPALDGQQMRELSGLALIVLGVVALLVIAYLIHPLALAVLLAVGVIAVGALLATPDDGEGR